MPFLIMVPKISEGIRFEGTIGEGVVVAVFARERDWNVITGRIEGAVRESVGHETEFGDPPPNIGR